MTISIKTQKMLWGRAAGRCSRPDCRLDLFEDETTADDPTLVGENCHIVSEADDGPRGDSTMAIESRNSYANLILLCRNHHKVIDAQPGEFTIQKLHNMKRDHEEWVKAKLGFDAQKQYDDELWAGIVDKWEKLMHVSDWRNWSGAVLSNGQPGMPIEVDQDLEVLRSWLLNRVWPDRYPELKNAFNNFRLVLEDFQNTFRNHAIPYGRGEFLLTRKFYQISEWDEKRYNDLSKQFDFHVDLVQDLMLELTRAANLICDLVRQYVLRGYRLNDGRLLVETGPTMDLRIHTVVVEYAAEEKIVTLQYPGLQEFLTVRRQRDMYFGRGEKP